MKYFTLVRMAITEEMQGNKWRCGEKKTLVHFWWKYKLENTIENGISSSKLKNRIVVWSSNPTVGIYPKEIKSVSRRVMYTFMFIIAYSQ